MRRHTAHINVFLVDESELLCYTKLLPGAKFQRKNSRKLHLEWRGLINELKTLETVIAKSSSGCHR